MDRSEADATTVSDGKTGEEGRGTAPLAQYLFVVLSCDRPLEGGARHALAHVDEVVFRRSEARTFDRKIVKGLRQLNVALPGRQLSSTHARLQRVSSRWTVEDCHSTNGTFVNGARIERCVLADGDIIELGRTVLLYREALLTPVGTPHDVDTRELTQLADGLKTLLPAHAHDLTVLQNVARSPLPLLLLGETGTGKEVLARAVHASSARSGPLVPVNCGAIPDSLIEGQLFGHVRGAFSGAVRDEVGLVRSADQGTLFLDEIGDLPASSQAALLRVLQEGEVQPVGSARSVKVDLRVLAATHRPLARLAKAEGFRSDLYARLNGFAHELPPLRERIEDLPILCESLLVRICPTDASAVSFAPQAVTALLRHDWPLNVRELQQTLARAVVVAQGARLDLSHLPRELRRASPPLDDDREISDAERRDDGLRLELIRQLTEHGANVSEVARSMGKARMQIHRWMKRYGLEPDDYRKPSRS